MVNKDLKVIFIHIPYTGGRSMRKLLPGKCLPCNGHWPAWKLKRKFPNEWEKYFKFVLIRNPWKRTVSWFSRNHFRKKAYLECKPENMPKKIFLRSKEWREYNEIQNKKLKENGPFFLEIKEKFTKWILSQDRAPGYEYYNWIYTEDKKNEIPIDYVAYTHKYREGVNYIYSKIGLPDPKKIIHINPSTHRNNYYDYFTPETRDHIAKLYEKDIKLFNLKYED